MGQSYKRSLKQSIDWKLLICYMLLVLIGWLNIFASSHAADTGSIFSFATRSGKQLVWILSGLSLAALILFVFNPRLWEVISVPTYLFVLFLLVAVIFLGEEVKGSRSWFEFGPVKFQPAELSKITTTLVLATFMSRPNFKMSNRRDFLIAAAIVIFPMLTIVAESETGSALVYVGFIFLFYREGFSGWFLFMMGMAILLFILTLVTNWWISMIVLGVVCLAYYINVLRHSRKAARVRRTSLRNVILAFAAGVAMIFATNFLFNHVLQDHQRARIEVLLGMKEDPAGVGYNVRQSMIAIGSGGFFGKGYLNGTQTTYGFVPEQSTDFIFCTVGEEWGFVGCLFVILVYALMIAWIIQDADRARESFTRIYGYGLASCLFMHLFINIGMTIGLMPVIGIPLPLFSYGGSSLWAFTTMLFIFIALNKQGKKYF